MSSAPLNVANDDLALLTDLYELTMLQAYWQRGMHARATFSLHFRRLPPGRRFMLACGQQYAAELACQLRFGEAQLARLATLGGFQDAFLDWLAGYRFSGDIWTLPEGTPVFPDQPLMEVDAPIAEAQLLESLMMNLVQLETVLASKAVRVVMAARGRPVVDFGMRRMHGIDAAVRGVRAYRAAGLSGTSNVLAGLRHDLPVRGTMAHSYVLAHDSETEAFRDFATLYPGTTLLVDTHDTLTGVQRVISLMTGPAPIDVAAIRLDSGDLGALAHQARALLDAAGLQAVQIVASSGLDEHRIAALLDDGAPIDAFGVGTKMGVSADAPVIDLSYKLVEYAGAPCIKHSPGKINLPCRKQVFRRREAAGHFAGDVIALRDEPGISGEALLVPLVRDGRVDATLMAEAGGARERVRDALTRLPPSLHALDEREGADESREEDGRRGTSRREPAPLGAGYPVTRSPGLARLVAKG